MTENRVSQVAGSLSSMLTAGKMRILAQFGMENYVWKVAVI